MSQNEHNRTQVQAANDGTDTPRPENAHGVAGQQQGAATQTTDKPNDTSGRHGGNHGNDGGQATRDAKGSSHRGDEPNAESNNTGGGSDNERKNQTKNTTADKSDYGSGNAAPSAANDGGKIDDANNQ
ncbi:hypothetical protein HNQ93_003026 [Hymenobacter luteus]|uniref:Uncharacterized protein n=2 Tax=Hymenobacter TaxID=89966 RepID=A0A7W9T273_9BACT|nr:MULTISPECIES: hypothetical protein [Hymenobacter]MBB4603262.1 hypothetical protein [Hymenobacter latericoloratus]MBB6060160.1 hypothetical protein [Hymenobacter luteus]